MLPELHDPFDLSRYADAQVASYSKALAEIRSGRKQTHWMWFVFPQFHGLGSSEMANRFAIRSCREAIAYLAHRVLGARYLECVTALQDLDQADPERVFGPIDAAKLKSSLTLFHTVKPHPLLNAALDRWFDGEQDQRTVELMTRSG